MTCNNNNAIPFNSLNYELVAAKGLTLNEESSLVFQLLIDAVPPIQLNLDILAQTLQSPTNFTFAIRSTTSSLIFSPTQTIAIRPLIKSNSVPLNCNSNAWIYICIIAVLVVAVTFGIVERYGNRRRESNYVTNDTVSMRHLHDDASIVTTDTLLIS